MLELLPWPLGETAGKSAARCECNTCSICHSPHLLGKVHPSSVGLREHRPLHGVVQPGHCEGWDGLEVGVSAEMTRGSHTAHVQAPINCLGTVEDTHI